MNFWGFSDLFKNVVTCVVTRLDKMRFGLLYLQNQSGWIVNECKCHLSEIYNIEDMTKSILSEKLTPFHVRTKDLKKDTATLFIRIHTRKVDVLCFDHASG